LSANCSARRSICAATSASSMSPPATAMRRSPQPGASQMSCRRTTSARCSNAAASAQWSSAYRSLPGSRCGGPPLRRCQLRCRAFDLRRHVHPGPAARRTGATSRLPAGRQDRTGQLDAGELHRPSVQDHRQIRSARTGCKIAGPVGKLGPSRHLVRFRRGNCCGERELRLPLQVARTLGGDLPHVLRPGA